MTAKGTRSLTVTRCPVLLPTSFGVTLMFTGVQEPPGTEVHGPGPTGVLLREEHHLGRVQPITGIQLAALQQDEAAPCRATERKHVLRARTTHVHKSLRQTEPQWPEIIPPTSPSPSSAPEQGSSRWSGHHVDWCQARAIRPCSHLSPPPALVLPHPILPVFLRDTVGTEQLCAGRGMAPSEPATGTGTHPRKRDLLPIFTCREIAGPLTLRAVPTCFQPYSNRENRH